MIDPAVLRGRLVAIAGLHETQGAICAAQHQPHLAAACDNARIGVLDPIDVYDTCPNDDVRAVLAQRIMDAANVMHKAHILLTKGPT